jgi:ABC-type molybdate transport system substrate-binding protein
VKALLLAAAEASRFVPFLLSPAGQAILARHGFDAPGLPLTPR